MSAIFDEVHMKRILEENELKNELPLYTDRALWEKISAKPEIKPVLDLAARTVESPLPPPTFFMYKDFFRTGIRKPWDELYHQTYSAMTALSVAECVKRDESCIDALENLIWSICEDSTWIHPHHIAAEKFDSICAFYDNDLEIMSAMIGQNLAEVKTILGERLHPVIRERISLELERRLFGPYMARDHYFTRVTNNFNSVCHCGVITAAILEGLPPNRLAPMISKAVECIPYYLQSFDESGCTSEGVGYWAYGFDYFTQLADILIRRTGGAVNLFETVKHLPDIVRFPLRARLSKRKFVDFADNNEEVVFNPYFISLLAKYFSLPELYSLPMNSINVKTSVMEIPEAPVRFETSVFYGGFDWMLARADGGEDSLVLAIKGDRNSGPDTHDHNDCGVFIVHACGESLIADLGTGKYTLDHFSEKRYEILTHRSAGHNVPLVNGFEQPVGNQYYAAVLEYAPGAAEDRIVYDLTKVYPDEANIRSLTRAARLVREKCGFVEITDEISFKDEAGSFVEHLVSYNKMIVQDGQLTVLGERANLKVACTGCGAPTVELLEAAVDGRDVYRARFEAPKAVSNIVVMTFNTQPVSLP